MKRIVLRFFIFAIALAFCLSTKSAASAHAGEPRLEISVDRLNPGGVLDVRGVAFDYEEVVTLVLIGSHAEISLGEIVANVDGEFIHIVTLPTDLTEGTYYVRGTSSHHWTISPPLTVWGTALQEGGGQGEREEQDGLLAPMPTYPPAAAATALVEPIPAPVEAPSVPSGWVTRALMLVVLLAFVAVVTSRLGRKRTGQ